MGEIDAIKKLQAMSICMKECGKDFLAIGEKIDEIFNVNMLLSDDIGRDMDKITAEVQLRVMMSVNKLTTLNELMKEDKKGE